MIQLTQVYFHLLRVLQRSIVKVCAGSKTKWYGEYGICMDKMVLDISHHGTVLDSMVQTKWYIGYCIWTIFYVENCMDLISSK